MSESLLTEGWSAFGSHIDQDVVLEFDGEDECGLPLWERPKPIEPTSYQLAILVGLNRLRSNIFGGRESRHSKEAPRSARRRRAKVTRASRRANRGK